MSLGVENEEIGTPTGFGIGGGVHAHGIEEGGGKGRGAGGCHADAGSEAGGGGNGFDTGDKDGEEGAPARRGVAGDGAAGGDHGAADHAQAHAGGDGAALGGEVWLEASGEDFRGHARTVVAHGQADHGAGGHGCVAGGGELDVSVGGMADGIRGVLDEVEKHLGQKAAGDAHAGEAGGNVGVEAGAAGDDGLADAAGFIPPCGEIDDLAWSVLGGFGGHLSQAGCEALEVAQALADGLEVRGERGAFDFRLEGVEVCAEGKDEVSQVMAKAGGEGSEGREAFLLAQAAVSGFEVAGALGDFFFEFGAEEFELGDVLHDADELDRATRGIGDGGHGDVDPDPGVVGAKVALLDAELAQAPGGDLVHARGGGGPVLGVGEVAAGEGAEVGLGAAGEIAESLVGLEDAAFQVEDVDAHGRLPEDGAELGVAGVVAGIGVAMIRHIYEEVAASDDGTERIADGLGMWQDVTAGSVRPLDDEMHPVDGAAFLDGKCHGAGVQRHGGQAVGGEDPPGAAPEIVPQRGLAAPELGGGAVEGCHAACCVGGVEGQRKSVDRELGDGGLGRGVGAGWGRRWCQ